MSLNKSVIRLTLVVLTLSLTGIAAPTAALATTDNGDEEIPEKVRGQLVAALNEKRLGLLEDKDADGRIFKRGAFSRSFRRGDDSTYRTTFLQDTIEGDALKTERFLVTLKRKDDGKGFEIVDEKLEDTFVGMYRFVLGDEEFYRFDEFSLEKEGLKVTATNGGVLRDLYRGKTGGLMVIADDLRFDYTPPAQAVQQFYQVYSYYSKRKPEALSFKPRHVTIACDGETCEDLLASAFQGLEETTRESVPRQLQAAADDYRALWEEGLSKNPFAGFSIPPEEDRRQLWICLNKEGHDQLLGFVTGTFEVPELTDHNFLLRYDTYQPKEVGIYVTRLYDRPGFSDTFFSPIIQYYSEETRNGNIDPYELEYRPDPLARYFEVEALEGVVELALEDAEKMKGDVTFGLKAREDIDKVRFFIKQERPNEQQAELKSPAMTIDSIQDGEGNELTWVKESGASGLVILSEPVSKGEGFDVRMQFATRGTVEKFNPSFSRMDRGGWLPMVRFGDFIDDFDLTVKVPKRYTTLGIGKKVSEKVVGDVNVTRWVSKSGVEFPSIIFGEYITGKPDFAAKKADGTEIPITVYVDKVSTNLVGDLITSQNEAEDAIAAIESGARAIRGKQLESIAEQAANSINLYREVYGVDYPYSKLDLVADPLGFAYGQAPSSLIYLGFAVFRGAGAVAGGGGIFFGSGGGTGMSKFLKSVVSHEVGHQWWGSVVANANNNNYWFVESLAEYSSAIFLETVYDKQEYDEQVEEWRRFVLNRDMTVNVQDASVLASPDSANYVAAVYNKGPMAFHMLRKTYGDEKFFSFLKMLAQELKRKEIVTRDIQRVAEKAYGLPMEWFFDQWIRGVGIPEFRFLYETRRTEDGNYLVQGVVQQRVVVGETKEVMDDVYYLGAVPVTVTSRKSENEFQAMIRVEGPESKFAFKVPEEPLEVAFNKYNEILAHEIIVNKSW